jgi:hypothetical protein
MTSSEKAHVQSVGERTSAEIDRRALENVSNCVDNQAETSILVEKSHARASGVRVDAAFAQTGDRSLSHQRHYRRCLETQPLAEDGGVDEHSALLKLDLGHHKHPA